MNTMARRLLVVTTTVALSSLAAPAMAGEITGEGTLMEVQGASECAYSGLNDGYIDPIYMEGPEDTQRVQNWGHVRQFLPIKGVPGFACNPSGKRGFPG